MAAVTKHAAFVNVPFFDLASRLNETKIPKADLGFDFVERSYSLSNDVRAKSQNTY